MRKFRKGQSTLEYVIILAAVVGAIIAVGIVLKPKLSSSYGKLADDVNAKIGEVKF
jgi:Flp pilus assembly pilin Flp